MPGNTLYQYIVKKFTKRENISWPRDTKIAKQIIKMYGDMDFWTWLIPEEWIYSVGFFISQPGKKYLAQKLLEYKKFKEAVQIKDHIDPKSSNF